MSEGMGGKFGRSFVHRASAVRNQSRSPKRRLIVYRLKRDVVFKWRLQLERLWRLREVVKADEPEFFWPLL